MFQIKIQSIHAKAVTVTIVFHRLHASEGEVVHLLQAHGYHVSEPRPSPDVPGLFTIDVGRQHGGVVTGAEIETLLAPHRAI